MKKTVDYDQFRDVLIDTLDNWESDPLVPQEELEGFVDTVWHQLEEGERE